MPEPHALLSPFDDLLWTRASSGDRPLSLEQALERCEDDGQRSQLTVWTVIADQDPLTSLYRAAAGTPLRMARLGPIGLVNVIDAESPFVIGAWPARSLSEDEKQTGRAFHLVGSVPVTDRRWRRLERWVRKAGPALAPFFVSESELVRIDAGLSEFGRVEVSRVTARDLRDNSSYNRGWAASQQLHRPTMREVLGEFAEIAAIRTLTVHVDDVVSLHLRRNSGATYYAGSFSIFENVVMARIALAAEERLALLSDRTRRINTPVPRPIGLRVPAKPFSTVEGVDALLEAMRSQSGVGIAVLHRNPYVQVAITDYRDGSNFDAFVTSDNEISIHPGYRSSLGALTRFTAHLSTAFDAREILEVEPLPPASLQDLLATG
jgi:hypothetical protein